MSQNEIGKYHWVLRKVGGRMVLFGPFLDGASIPADLKNRMWRRRLHTGDRNLATRMLKSDLSRNGRL